VDLVASWRRPPEGATRPEGWPWACSQASTGPAANPYLRIALPTGLGEGRNLIVVRASDLLIGVSGGYGTLSEIALALKTGKPVIGLETWPAIEGINYVSSPQGAMEAAVRLLKL
jgi:uncharacterized protein (TIGR00725 family)